MKRFIEAVAFAGLLGAVGAPLACSSKASGLDGDDGGGGTQDASTSSSSGSSGGNGSSGGSSGSSSSSSGAFATQDDGAVGMGTGVCKTGTYSGPFSCGFYFDMDAGTTPPVDGGSADGGLFAITGSLSFSLKQSMSGELGQDVASGTFAISSGLFISGMATLGGTLDCSTGVFTGALSNGTYNVFFGLFTGSFDGPLTSEYNGTTFSFVNGIWSLTVPGEGYCQGQWNADFRRRPVSPRARARGKNRKIRRSGRKRGRRGSGHRGRRGPGVRPRQSPPS